MDFSLAKFTLRDLWAQVRTKPALALGREIQRSPPHFINLEPTCFCNLDCTICSYDGSRKKGYISRETVEIALEQAVELGVTEVRYFLAGEPFFHPHLAEFIASANKKNLFTLIHTNATFMPEDRVRAVLEAGLDRISFSIDGESAQEYEAVRIGAKFDQVMENIIRFLEIKKSLGKRFPLTILQVIKLPDSPNPTQITREFKERFSGLPVDEFFLLKPIVWPDQEPKDFNSPPGSKYYPCWVPWTSLSIGWDGRVFWCCGDLNGRGILGDIHHTTLSEIWNGEHIRFIRRNLVKGNLKDLPLCMNCEAVYHRHNPIYSDLREYVRQVIRAF